jgi:hypothetical protein
MQQRPIFTTDDADGLADVIATAIEAATTPLYKRIVLLEGRAARDRLELEALKAKAITFEDTWRPGRPYARGSVVTRQQQRWIAIVDGATADPRKPHAPREWRLFEDGRTAA